MLKDPFVLSIGGSLLIPRREDGVVKINDAFVEALSSFSVARIENEADRFIYVVGGGAISRIYQDSAFHVAEISSEERDNLGIMVSHLNAEYLKIIFKDLAHPEVIKNPEGDIDFKNKILLAAGWKPGRSTNHVAILMAKKYGIKKVVSLSNIDAVYDDDPRLNVNAKRYTSLTWDQYRSSIPKDWSPGLHTPFDPIASKDAQESGISVAVMSGDSFRNVGHCLDNKVFEGTLIS